MTLAKDNLPSEPPRRGRLAGLLRRAGSFLVSRGLAITLLAGVLVCCLVGVTAVRPGRAAELIFSTLWFNTLLVLLALSSASAFFSRIWRRKLTLVSVGMILFHVSFAAMLGGIVYNRLFYFRGVLRLTEGETLPNGQIESYDVAEHGRFFDRSQLPGETTLVRMHANYRVGSENKRAAYEIAVDSGEERERGIIYPTEYMDFEGMRFFSSKEGYSVLVVLYGPDGRENYGAYVPLQSFKQADETFVYATGTANGMEPFHFPAPPEEPRAVMLLAYLPSREAERGGQVRFDIQPFESHGVAGERRSETVMVGGRLELGGFALSPKEIRYWVGMEVRHDPGLVVILSSLCLGVVGMTLIFIGRLRPGPARRRAKEMRAATA